jgi:hypothetical protein
MERKIYPHHTSYLKKLHLHTQHEIAWLYVSVNHNDLQFPNVSLKQKTCLKLNIGVNHLQWNTLLNDLTLTTLVLIIQTSF